MGQNVELREHSAKEQAKGKSSSETCRNSSDSRDLEAEMTACNKMVRNVSTLCKILRGDVWRALLPKTLPAAGPVQVLLHPARAIGRMRAVRSPARVGRTVTVAGIEEVSGMVAGTGRARVGVARVRLRTRKGRCEGMDTFNSSLGGRSEF